MTSIQWTDETWNPTTGCSRVSEGCRHCYIERTPPFRMQGRKLGDPVQLHPDRLDQPLRWKKPRRVFVNSLSDLFHEDIPDEFLDRVFAVMASTPRHTYQILTKRPERMRAWERSAYYRMRGQDVNGQTMCDDRGRVPMPATLRECQACQWPLPNVQLGVSIEDQKTADERIPILLQTPAAVRFVSAEPLLGPVVMKDEWLLPKFASDDDRYNRPGGRGLDWVIVGGESGPQARPCDVGWIRSLVEQCRAAAVSCFVKQLGSYVADRNDAGFEGDEPTSWPMDTDVDDPSNEWNCQGLKIRVRLRDRKGGDPAEWPEDLRVREMPA